VTPVAGRRAIAGSGLLERQAWVVAVWALLAVLLVWYATLIPAFGEFQLTSITKNSLPLVYLAIGQAVIVIAGGIDLSLGSLLLLGNVLAARFMDERSMVVALALAVVIIAGIAALNGIVGLVISISGVPDIVVTLATSYMWSGLALWILPSPGGGTAPGFRWLFTGSESGIGGSIAVPVVMLVGPAVALLVVMRRTRAGLSMYAIGSDRIAAHLVGVDLRLTKVGAYALGGGLAALAGLATVAITGTGDPRFSVGANATLNSVAAVVLGGIALTGGVGSVLGAVAAAIILVMLIPILSAMGVDSNNAQVIQGVLIAGVMMVGGVSAQLRRRRS